MLINNADELSNIDQANPSSQTVSDYPFVDIEAETQKISEEEKKNQEKESSVSEPYVVEEQIVEVKPVESPKEEKDEDNQEGYEEVHSDLFGQDISAFPAEDKKQEEV